MMFALVAALSDDVPCGSPDYPRVLYPQDSAQSYTITQAGAMKFINCGLQNAMVYAQQTVIPDMDFDLNLGVT